MNSQNVIATAISRRALLKCGLVGAAAGIVTHAGSAGPHLTAAEASADAVVERVTLAQVATTGEISQNLAQAERVFAQARTDRAGWVFFPELFLTGTHNGNRFRQDEVASAFARISKWCAESRVTGLIGTGWVEDGKTYNQVRVVDRDGRLASVYAKTCLTYGDAEEFTPGPIDFIHKTGGLTFGILICNDLWVTPGFSDGPNPHLSLKLAREGAQVIFQAVGSGSDQRFLAYHDANVLARAAEAKCPMVVVNGFQAPASNVTSGVAGPDFEHLSTLPRDREAIETVEFRPRSGG